MRIYSTSENIAAPASAVWPLLCAVSSWPEWLSTFSIVKPIGQNGFRVGAQFHVEQPKLRPAKWEVTSLAPERSFAWQSKSSGFVMSANHAIEPIGDSNCKLTLEFTFSGALARLVALFAGSTAQRYITTECRTFKRLAEAANADASV